MRIFCHHILVAKRLLDILKICFFRLYRDQRENITKFTDLLINRTTKLSGWIAILRVAHPSMRT